MIKWLPSLLLFSLTPPQLMAREQEILPQSILPIIEFMAPLTKSAEYVALVKNQPQIDCNTQEIKKVEAPIFFTNKKNKDDWSISVTTTMTSPPNTFTNEYMAKTGPDLKNQMNNLMKTDFKNHQDRLNSISKVCSGKSEIDRIQMASYLGSQLSNIYDYDRTDPKNSKSNAVVKPEDQWNAIHERFTSNDPAVSGVCRDATFTLTQFMVACGFSKKQLSIQGFRTEDAGHQIVTIRDSKGKLYTINWSELYATEEKGGVAPQPNSSNLMSGISYTSYNADGKLVSHYKTELGEIIKAVSGGTVDNPNYQPHLLRLEANLNALTLNVFKTQTNYAENAYGVGGSYEINKNPDDLFVVNMGMALVKNEKDTLNSNGKVLSMEQTILYFQTESGIEKKFDITKNKDGSLTVKPFFLTSSEFAKISTTHTHDNKKFNNSESTLSGKLGAEIVYNTDDYSAWIKAQTKGLFAKNANTEANGTKLGVALDTTTVATGITHEGKKYITTMEAQTDISYFENRYAVSASLLDKSTNSHASILYSVYDRGYGKRDDYVLVQGEKNFSFKKIGTVSIGLNAQVPLDGKYDPTIMATLKVKGR